MKILIVFTVALLIAITHGVFVPPRPGHHKVQQVGTRRCTWGPSYWCKNLTNAAECSAVKHCIQTVWIHQKLPPDTTSVCQTCLDMVKQARDQLLSNDTQELIKEVFEGSCQLLRIKPVVKECDKIADEFIPQLIDTLASEMNPQVVCSVAGLCNNERIHRMIEAAGEVILPPSTTPQLTTCQGCHSVVDLMQTKLKKSNKEDVLNGFLLACGKLGSFSDSCSNLIVTYFTEIYDFLLNNFNSEQICLMSGECSAQFHKHANIEITPMADVGVVHVIQDQDDLPCDLCVQLVHHLRDLLVTNTTEDEFKMVLEGLCKQTKSFQTECLNLVDTYYSAAYQFLVNELNPNAACSFIGICPGVKQVDYIAPLLSPEAAAKVSQITKEKKVGRVSLKKTTRPLQQLTAENAQLPIDLIMPPHTQVYNKQTCVFCEYFLHYVQQAMSDPVTEEKIKAIIDKACSELPSSINNTCRNFVDAYEPAMIAILAQQIDPSQVCPLIKACPAGNKQVEIFMEQRGDTNCPLCLFAVTKLESMVKDKKTEDNIRNALTKLCNHLPESMVDECNDFVQTYTNELVELLVADLSPEEVCTYLKMCSPKKIEHNIPREVIVMLGGDIETNLIPDNTINGIPTEKHLEIGPQCVICEFVMKEIEDQLDNNKTDEEIKHIVHSVCNVMPKSVSSECNQFVDEYADTIIQLLIQALEPADICSYIGLCSQKFREVNVEVTNCALCEITVKAIEKILNNPKVDHNADHVLEKACRALPIEYKNKCENLVKQYGRTLIHYVTHFSDKLICQEVHLCNARGSIPALI